MAIFPGTMYDDMIPLPGMDNSGDDVLWGGAGDDDISGGAGDDLLIGGPGADVLDGGPGHDIASYTLSRLGVHIDLSAAFYDPDDVNAPVRGGDATGDQLSGIEELWGSARADKLIGNHAENRLFGNGGNDQVYGGGGNDFIRGGYEDDVLRGDGGADKLFGDKGVDELSGGIGNDMLFGGQGDDTLLDGGAGDDVLEGGMGADVLMGGAGMDIAAYTQSDMAVTINLSNIGSATKKAAEGGHAEGDTIMMDVEGVRGSMHDDMITGSSAAVDDATTEDVDESVMYPGHNKLYGDMGNDSLMGMGGNDLIHGGQGMDTLYGGAGNDTLKGDMGDDALKGEEGDDTLVGGPGADKLFGHKFSAATKTADNDGDSMNDTADYSMSDAGVTIDLSKTSRTQPNPVGEGGHAEGDELVAIEHLTGSMHDDMLEGTNDDDNTLKGLDGDDMLTGNGGDDTIDGGKGMDTINGGAGADMLTGGDGDDTFVYRMINDTRGNMDNDDLDGDESMQRLVDTDGDDTTAMGDPMVSGGGGMDTVDASGATAAVTVDLNVMRLVKAGTDAVTEDLTANPPVAAVAAVPAEIGPVYTSIEQVIGGEGDDTLTGNEKTSTTLIGGEGNDTLTGGEKDDTLEGGAGLDSLIGGMGADMLDGGGGNDTLDGGVGADDIRGGSGDDSITGGSGADTLAGGLGNDMLDGGTGADTFVYTGGDDTITNFSISRAGSDKIDVTALDLSEAQLEAIVDASNGLTGTDVFLKFTANTDGSYVGSETDFDIRLSGFDSTSSANDLATSDFII